MKTKRLIGNVPVDVHLKIKVESAKANLSMNDVFTMSVMETFKIDLKTMFTDGEIEKYNTLKSSL